MARLCNCNLSIFPRIVVTVEYKYCSVQLCQCIHSLLISYFNDESMKSSAYFFSFFSTFPVQLCLHSRCLLWAVSSFSCFTWHAFCFYLSAPVKQSNPVSPPAKVVFKPWSPEYKLNPLPPSGHGLPWGWRKYNSVFPECWNHRNNSWCIKSHCYISNLPPFCLF